MIARHQRLMRNGYMIPLSMEWMFWPMGVQRTITVDLPVLEGEPPRSVEIPNPVLNESRVGRRYTITNRSAFMAAMVAAKAVKEVAR